MSATGQVSPLARRNAVVYLVGMSAAFLGGSAMTLAAGIWVKSLTGSSSLAALVSVCIYGPSMFGPLAGLLADRVRRRPLLISVNVSTAAAMLLMLAVHSEEQLGLIFVAMTCYGAALALIDPAEQALFVVMLPTEERQRINGLRMSLQEGGKLVAPLAGAGLFSLFGGGVVAALTAVTFVVAALAIARLRVPEPPLPTPTAGWVRETAAGFAHIWRQPSLRLATASAAAAMFVAGTLTAAQFSLVDALGRAPSFLGVITGLIGAGSIVAGLTSARLIRRHGEPALLALGLSNGCIGYALLATGRLPLVLVGGFVMGFALPWTVIAVVNLGQRLTPIHLQGRVASATGLLLFAPQPFSHLLGAGGITVADYSTVFLTVSAASAANLTIVLLHRRAAAPEATQHEGSTAGLG
jgi:MFS family permease